MHCTILQRARQYYAHTGTSVGNEFVVLSRSPSIHHAAFGVCFRLELGSCRSRWCQRWDCLLMYASQGLCAWPRF